MTISEAKEMYLNSNISQKSLALVSGLPYSLISKTARSEGWVREKRALSAPEVEIVSPDVCSSSVERVELETADKIIMLLNDAFSQVKQFNSYVTKLKQMTESGISEELTEVKLESFDMQKLLSAVNAFEKAVRLRRSITQESKDDEGQHEGGIVILPDADMGDAGSYGDVIKP